MMGNLIAIMVVALVFAIVFINRTNLLAKGYGIRVFSRTSPEKIIKKRVKASDRYVLWFQLGVLILVSVLITGVFIFYS